MATVQLVLTKPINASLQAKALDTGAWDVIYFTRIEDGKQVGDIERLGRCVNIQSAAGDYLSEELLQNANFSGAGHWDMGAGWSLFDSKAQFNGGAFAGISQIIPGLKPSKLYRIKFDISTDASTGPLVVSLGGNDTQVGGALAWISDSGQKSIDVIAGPPNAFFPDIVFYAGAQPTRWNGTIDNVSLKEVVSVDSNQYLVHVEVDSVAQTPNDGDFICLLYTSDAADE